MLNQYLIEGKNYYLIRDLAREIYPNSTNPSSQTIRNRLSKLNIPVFAKNVLVKTRRSDKIFKAEVAESDLISQSGLIGPALEIILESKETENCQFYIIQKYPVDAPQIIKLGKTLRTVEERSREFYVYEPKILLTASILSYHEKTLIDMITVGSKRLGDEEFWIENLEPFLERAKSIITYLPNAA